MSSFWNQLRERKYVEWIIGYLAGAWLLLQVADFLRENFDWSPIFVRVLTVVLGFGFLALLVVAWFHGKSGTQRAPRTEMIVLLAISVAGAGVAWYVASLGVSDGGAARSAIEESQTPVLLAAFDPATATGSIAILPFLNMTADAQNDYLSDGITEDITAELGKSARLRVISRTSTMRYKGTTKSIGEIGAELGVGTILEGSVRVQGDQVRVVAQLIDVATDAHLWTQTYDRDLKDIFATQSEIARDIATALNATLLPLNLAAEESRGGTDPDAYRLYSRGKALATSASPADRERAVVYLDSAIRKDPDFGQAYAELANLQTPLLLEGMSAPPPVAATGTRVTAAAVAEKALELNPRSSEARSAWAMQRAMQDGDLEGAEKSMQEAVQSNPNSVQSRMRLAQVLAARDKTEEAQRELRTVVMLDPMSSVVNARAGDIALTMRQFDDAERYIRRAIELDSTSVHPHITMAMLEKDRGDLEGAIAEAGKALAMAPDDPNVLSTLGYVLAVAGRTEDARDIAEQLQAQVEAGKAPVSALAQVHFALGEMREAVDWLKQGDDDPRGRFSTMLNPRIRESLDQLRSDPILGDVVDSLMRKIQLRPPSPPARPDTTNHGRRSGTSPRDRR